MTELEVDGHQILTDGRTVWVNGPDASNLGRFGPGGVDVHRTFEEQLETGEQCLFCKEGPTEERDWKPFVDAMREFHGVEVPDMVKPRRFAT